MTPGLPELSSTMTHPSERQKDIAIGIAVFVLALGVRLYGLDFQPYWMDEITAIWRASDPISQLVADSLTSHHLPTYFLLLSWFLPFGVGEFILRLPSAVCSALTCAVAANIGRSIGGRAAGFLAGMFSALSPLQVNFGQEVRPQALVVLLIAIALRALIALSLDPKAASLPLRRAGAGRRLWAIYFLATLGAVNVQGIALLWGLTGLAATFLIANGATANRVGLMRNSTLVHGAITVLALPGYVMMYFFVHAYGRLLEGLDWIPAVTTKQLGSDILSIYLLQISSPVTSRVFPGSVPFIGIVVVVFAGLGLASLWRKPVVCGTLVLTTVALPVTFLALSLTLSLWLPRYLLWSAIPFFILAGLGISALPTRLHLAAVSLVSLLSFVNLVPYYSIEGKPRWDLAAAKLEPAIEDHDLILVDDVWVPDLLRVYLSRDGVRLPNDQWTMSVSAARACISRGGRVWAVFGRVGQVDREDPEAFRRRLSLLGPPAAELRAGLDIHILRFDRPVASVRDEHGGTVN